MPASELFLWPFLFLIISSFGWSCKLILLLDILFWIADIKELLDDPVFLTINVIFSG